MRERREEEKFAKVWILVWNLSKMYGYMFGLYGLL